MKGEKEKVKDLKKVQSYLKDSKKNLLLLKRGKKPRRKLKFLIKDHLFFTILFLVLIVGATTIPLLIKEKTDDKIEQPEEKKVKETLTLLSTNFTDSEGIPINELGNYTESSKLIILSTLSFSMLYLAGFNITIEQLSLQKDNILSILNDGSFVQFNNNSQKLSIFYQFLGLYALIQLLYATKNTEIGFSIDILFNSLNKQLREYYNKENRLFIDKNATEAFLVDQSLALWVIAITILYFNVESIFEFYLPDIIQDVLYSLNQDYRNATTNKIVSSISNKTKEPIQLEVTSFDLLILVAALSRVNLLYDYFFDNDLSSINLFENIINQYTDEKLIVYEKRFLNGHLLIRNQCFFTLTSYLLHLTVTGNQSLNVVTTNYWKDNKGFIEEINANKFSAEANYYGLITLASPEWSKGEYFYIQDNYKGNAVTSRADVLTIFVSLVIVFIINKRRKRIK
ncbi:MAG: hypothetical protein K9W45_04540 [Candidatus Heimdallarchaeum aukensis]|uniref:Uncharacterized protein n=1 Tax=Candidatus Heimdallarchaeum aukensis TaxID=2876573 RepID=A0A9Y1BMV9_9ARCH|nr:MAG: hypothetical protein K9W45_04540 [Candidatus Heimdallarchaeum aukensis]